MATRLRSLPNLPAHGEAELGWEGCDEAMVV
jgi:hypothetical protein